MDSIHSHATPFVMAAIAAIALTGCSREWKLAGTIDGPSRPVKVANAIAIDARASAYPQIEIRTSSGARSSPSCTSGGRGYVCLLPPGASIESAFIFGNELLRPRNATLELETREVRVWSSTARRAAKLMWPLRDDHNDRGVDEADVLVATSAENVLVEITSIRRQDGVAAADVFSVCRPADGSGRCTTHLFAGTGRKPLDVSFDVMVTAYGRCVDEACRPPAGAGPRIVKIEPAR